MTSLTDVNAVYLLFIFVIPGFVAFQAVKIICPSIGRSGKDFYLAFVTLSGLNFTLFGFMVALSFDENAGPYFQILIWAAFIFVLPLLEGIVVGGLIQNNVLQKILRSKVIRWASIRPTSFGISAWDSLFSNIEARFAVVTLVDGTLFRAALAADAHMSADANERDIYFDHLYEEAKSGEWKRVPKSLYVAKDQIRTIEFFDPST